MQTIKRELNEKQEGIADTLMSLGLGRKISNALAYLHDKKEVETKDLERAARLHQPEVSIAVKEMTERGWITEWNCKKHGKGRPSKAYSLKVPFTDIITQLEEEQKTRAGAAQARIARLKELRKPKA